MPYQVIDKYYIHYKIVTRTVVKYTIKSLLKAQQLKKFKGQLKQLDQKVTVQGNTCLSMLVTLKVDLLKLMGVTNLSSKEEFNTMLFLLFNQHLACQMEQSPSSLLFSSLLTCCSKGSPTHTPSQFQGTLGRKREEPNCASGSSYKGLMLMGLIS